MPTVDREFPLTLAVGAVGAAASPDAAAPLAPGCSFEPWIDDTGHRYGDCLRHGDQYYVRLRGVGTFAFTRHSLQVRGTPEPGVPTDAFHDHFWREVAPYVLQRHAWEVLHASALEVAGVCVALSGNSEMGKSTLAQAWRQRGGDVYADDAIPFRVEHGQVHVRPIPFRIRLRPPAIRYFGPSALGAREPMERERSAPGRDTIRLQAIYLLQRRPDEEQGAVSLVGITPREALPALLHQAYCLTLRDRARNGEMVEGYLALANAVPTFRLAYPTGLKHLDGILDHVTAHVANQVIGQTGEARR